MVPVPSDQSREELLENYLPFVRQVAERVHRHLPRHHIDIESLVQSGVVGLLEAAQRYNASRGVAFADYARYRIRGEIIEYLRSLDWASRSVRAWGRRQAAARSRLTARLGREAEPTELAAELQISLKEYYRFDQHVSEATLLNLEDVSPASEDHWRRTQEEHADPASIDPLATLEQKDLVTKLAGAIELLSEQEKQVLTLSYYEELTLREIGQVWDLTEGRICQIRSRAVDRLREILAEAGVAQAPDKKTQKYQPGRRSKRRQPAAQPFPLPKAA
jgi:RNA polymerase sigma factor for flagellar operon FliA